MPSKILSTFETTVKPTCTLASLGNGAGRIAAVIDNTAIRAGMGLIYLRARTGAAAPTANTPIKVYLCRRSNDGVTDIVDGATSAAAIGTADAALAAEPTNAECLGSIIVDATTAKDYYKSFIAYDLSPKFSLVVWNAVGQTLDSTGSNFDLQVQLITPEGQ